MPSPFPGMDPFLESPDHFPNLHHHMITYIQETVQPRLPKPYIAKTGERVWIELENVPQYERREGFLEIYTQTGDRKRLVTAIEVLSSSNKASSGPGRNLYLRKQQEILDKEVHLVEIDLLRGGLHTTAVPQDAMVATCGDCDYHVSLHRFTERDRFTVFPIRLSQRLPKIPIPLLPDDPAVVIDLQAIFDRCYEVGGYEREIDYRNATPVLPLRPEQREWLRGVLDAAPNS